MAFASLQQAISLDHNDYVAYLKLGMLYEQLALSAGAFRQCNKTDNRCSPRLWAASSAAHNLQSKLRHRLGVMTSNESRQYADASAMQVSDRLGDAVMCRARRTLLAFAVLLFPDGARCCVDCLMPDASPQQCLLMPHDVQ